MALAALARGRPAELGPSPDSSKRASEPDAEPRPRARWSTHYSVLATDSYPADPATPKDCGCVA